ncbi:MAG: YdcF family protein [Cyanobacteriota bacterium]|nr:YdcF family protein [Cyanobacteriota bacterium]
MGFLLSKLLPLALYPLGLALLLQLAGQGARGWRWSTGLSSAGIALLWMFAMPITSRQLIWGLEERAAALTPALIPQADAVVVLGGGLRPSLPPRRGVEVGEAGDRLLTGVRLLRKGRAPLLLTSGGQVSFTEGDPALPEAIGARDLAVELGVPAGMILLNPGSRTTAEEAEAIDALARQRRWKRVLLVTSASHMPRSLATFRRQTRLNVIPVACDYLLPDRASYGRPTLARTVLDLVPDANALADSTRMLKEHIGLLVYRIRGDAL